MTQPIQLTIEDAHHIRNVLLADVRWKEQFIKLGGNVTIQKIQVGLSKEILKKLEEIC